MCGSVSGGCVETDVYENAMEVMQSGEPKLLTLRHHRRAGLERRPAVRRRDRRLRGGGRVRLAPAARGAPATRADAAVLFTVVEGDGVGAKALVVEGGETIGDGVPAGGARAVRRARAARPQPDRRGRRRRRCSPSGTGRRRGCSSTARSTPRRRSRRARSSSAGRRSSADARATFLTPERIPSADQLIPKWPEEAIAEVAPDHQTAIVVLTHDDKFDEPALIAALDDRGVLHRRARLAPEPGASPRAPARGGRRARRSSRGSRARAASTSAPTRRRRRRSSILAEILAVRAQRAAAGRCATRSSGSTSRWLARSEAACAPQRRARHGAPALPPDGPELERQERPERPARGAMRAATGPAATSTAPGCRCAGAASGTPPSRAARATTT